MTDTDHQPPTTTDDLTEHVARWLHSHWGSFSWDGPYGKEAGQATFREHARALLTSGPLADRLTAHARVEALAQRAWEGDLEPLSAQEQADLIRSTIRGDW